MQLRPIPDDFLEKVYQLRERIIQESKGHIFEDSAELVRQMREERTRYLEELHKSISEPAPYTQTQSPSPEHSSGTE